MDSNVAIPRLVPTPEADASYRAKGLWEGTFGSFLDDQRRERPTAPGIVDRGVTYEELGRRVDALAASLVGLGVTPGRSVLVQLPNWWEAIVAFHAMARIGAVADPVIPI